MQQSQESVCKRERCGKDQAGGQVSDTMSLQASGTATQRCPGFLALSAIPHAPKGLIQPEGTENLLSMEHQVNSP